MGLKMKNFWAFTEKSDFQGGGGGRGEFTKN